MERQVLREYRRENRRRRRRGEAVEAPGTSTEQRHNDLENSNNTREVNGDDHMAEDGSGNNDPIDQATSLVLRTRIFQSGESNDMRSHAAKAENDDDYLGDGCTICMMRLIDGERVGSLACKHVFHVRCLKPWLQRCNICPLCKQDEVAEPQYEKNTDENDEPSVTRRTDSVEESSNELMEESQGSAPTSSDGG